MSHSKGENHSGSPESLNQDPKRHTEHKNTQDGSAGSEPDSSNNKGCPRQTGLKGEAEETNDMPNDYQGQLPPRQNLPGIRDILHEPALHTKSERDASPWSGTTSNPQYSHSRSPSTQGGYTSENSAVAHRMIVARYGPSQYKEIHPPMAVPPRWEGLLYAMGDGRYIPVNPPPASPDPAPEGSPVSSKEAGQRSNKPDWGKTKSGNPRKRQAEACRNCRHKKIKCDVLSGTDGPPRCVNCDKTGTTCTWQSLPSYPSNPQSGHETETTQDVPPTYKSQASISSQGSPGTPSPKLSPSSNHLRPSAKAGEGTDYDFGDTKRPLTKKPRLDFDTFDRKKFWERPPSQFPHYNLSSRPSFERDVDPFRSDSQAANGLLTHYFNYHDTPLGKILPRRSFTRWCTEHPSKSKSGLMLIYATLAVGTIYSTAKALKSIGQHLAECARDLAKELEKTSINLCLEVALTRLHLAAFYWAVGQPQAAFDHTAGGTAALSALRFNTEEGCHNNFCRPEEYNDFGFTKAQLIECRRRTFWYGYMAGRFRHYGACPFQCISDDDISVLTPNSDDDYEAGMETMGPLFDRGYFDHRESGLTATMIGIGSIWGIVTVEGRRSVNRGREAYRRHYEPFYDEMYRRLEGWRDSLPDHLQYSVENTRLSIREERFVEYYVVNACYHMTAMKLNRHARADLLPDDVVVRNLKRTRNYARQFLDLLSMIAKPDNNNRPCIEDATCQAFPLETIMFSCDIVSSRGNLNAMTEVQHLLGSAKAIVSRSERVFNSALRQRICLERRLDGLGGYVAMKDSGITRWSFSQSIDEEKPPTTMVESNSLSKPMDLVYAAREELFFQALEGL